MKKLILILLFIISMTSMSATVKVYTRTGCPHCEEAKDFFSNWIKQNPQHEVKILNIWEDKEALKEFRKFALTKDIKDLGVPLIRVKEEYLVGFSKSEEMKNNIERLIKGDDIIKNIKIPFFGSLKVKNYGALSLSIIIGLIDGFNPCAMWVLLILLSLLIHLKDRKKMILISSTFVVVSGVVYFIFMNAWLLLYDYVSLGRKMQIIIGSIALAIGLIHIKDFILFKRGLSLSIPDSVKTYIARKASWLARESSLLMSLITVIVLAIFVNFIELMCTAGLPAIYTKILQDNGIVGFQRTLYLLTYTVSYMIDDAFMVAVAVITLRQTRLQEKSGRWLKLISGLVLSILAVLMIFYPDLLLF